MIKHAVCFILGTLLAREFGLAGLLVLLGVYVAYMLWMLLAPQSMALFAVWLDKVFFTKRRAVDTEKEGSLTMFKHAVYFIAASLLANEFGLTGLLVLLGVYVAYMLWMLLAPQSMALFAVWLDKVFFTKRRTVDTEKKGL